MKHDTEEIKRIATQLLNIRDSALRATSKGTEFKLTVEDTFTLSKARSMLLELERTKQQKAYTNDG